MRVLFVGDVHVPAGGPVANLPSGEPAFENIVPSHLDGLGWAHIDSLETFRNVADIARDNDVDAIMYLGDITHNHGKFSARQVKLLAHAMRTMPCDVFVISGNHDIDMYGNCALHDILSGENVTVVSSSPAILPGGIYGVPYGFPVELPIIAVDDIRVVAAHHDFVGARYNVNLPPVEHGERPVFGGGVDVPIISGHVHMFQCLKCDFPEEKLHERGVLYIGSSRQVTKAERDEIPKVLLWDSDDDSVEWFELTYAARYVVHDSFDGHEDWDKKDIHIVRIPANKQVDIDSDALPPRVMVELVPIEAGEFSEEKIAEAEISDVDEEQLLLEAVEEFVYAETDDGEVRDLAIDYMRGRLLHA